MAERGGTLLCLGLPPGSSFGVDQQLFTTGPKFQGVKMLPPGTHFVAYSAAGKHGDAAPFRGFFVHLASGQVPPFCRLPIPSVGYPFFPPCTPPPQPLKPANFSNGARGRGGACAAFRCHARRDPL